MVDDTDLDRLRELPAPPVDADAKARALTAAMSAFREAGIEKKSAASQGMALLSRLISQAMMLWSEMMSNRRFVAQTLVAILALPIAGYVGWMLSESGGRDQPDQVPSEMAGKPTPGPMAQLSPPSPQPARPSESGPASGRSYLPSRSPVAAAPGEVGAPAAPASKTSEAQTPAPVTSEPPRPSENKSDVGTPPSSGPSYHRPQPAAPADAEADKLHDNQLLGGAAAPVYGQPGSAAPEVSKSKRSEVREKEFAPSSWDRPPDGTAVQAPDTSRIRSFASNPIQITKENPVSTFSADVDTASYSYVRRVLNGGAMPQPDTVRVEEMINYFPYDWQGPESDKTPFKATVSVMPTPWNTGTKLLHIAIKGYDVKPAEKPKANLVFLIDVSGSMSPPDRLPLLKTAFRMLVDTLSPDDTVAIVTYAGTTNTALPPTKVSNKTRILSALERLRAGGSTAGAAGIREAYRLAQESFVKGGINRVMLATDGDFNVGQTSDADLKHLIEAERESGVFLSVFGVGRDNLNDRMMQELAQSGNGTAAYIDTLAEAEKVLVQEASSTIFPIAKDVKIQVEFNPATVSEYRLIGYETRALKREDFNNDRVDAGEIGSGHSVTAIYEITPKGSPAQIVDDLRYRSPLPAPAGKDNKTDGEFAFVKIRYKAPDGDASSLITTPVTPANELASFDAASTDQRFSVAVAAFAQKLRHADQLAGFGYDKIMDIANHAKGEDPFGYRAEFVTLVRLASRLEK